MTISGFTSSPLYLSSSPTRPRSGGIRGKGVSLSEFGVHMVKSQVEPEMAG